jgi:hypothetical protein
MQAAFINRHHMTMQMTLHKTAVKIDTHMSEKVTTAVTTAATMTATTATSDALLMLNKGNQHHPSKMAECLKMLRQMC